MNGFGTLHFLPWLRRGLARSLTGSSTDGAPSDEAAEVEVSVVVGDGAGTADSDPILQQVRIRGPGEVVGINPNQILRTDPVDGVLDFEPNYFPYVELAAPDLPWMFTPAKWDANDRLVPWVALVVVRNTEGITLGTKSGAALPVLSISAPADASQELPDLSESWAWAHAQSTADLASVDAATAFEQSPEDFVSRLMCSRHLQPDTHYIAAIVPTFEDGRRAGLGLAERDGASVDTSSADWWKAWTDTTVSIELPVYHSWVFRTGAEGDFEALVRRLTPRELDAGTKDFDIGDQGTAQLPPDPPERKLVSWKGALVSPLATEVERDEAHWDSFRSAMRSIVQDGLEVGSQPAAGEAYEPLNHDPIVGPPAYGALPVGEDEIPQPVTQGQSVRRQNKPLWLGEANLDPVHRSAGGLGSEVVRRNQESLMGLAWQQAVSLREINRVLNWTRSSAEIATVQKQTQIDGLSNASLLQLAAPAKSRLKIGAQLTAAGRLAETSLPRGMVSSAFRRIGRPEGPVGRAVRVATGQVANAATSVTKACIEDLEATLSYTAFVRPTGLHIGDETLTAGIPGSGDTTIVVSTSTTNLSPSAVLRSGWARRRGLVPGARVVSMPKKFTSAEPWNPITDIVDAFVPPVFGASDIAETASDVRSAIDPAATLSAKMSARITAPGDPFANGALPAFLSAEPSFTDPLYEGLRNIDPGFLLPGVGEIPGDTIGLTFVNAAFVEAFLVGANYELGREFAWREYPANLGDTWLRVFWNSIPTDDLDEVIEDIPPIADWNSTPYNLNSGIGQHQIGFGTDGTLVLIIKGDLLRKYPDTVIYATKAVWNETRTVSDGETIPVNTFREEEIARSGQPVERRDPVFIGTLDTKTVFLGFALTEDEALGPVDSEGVPIPGGDSGDRDGGWFFAFEEPPSEPRFGLDVGEEADAGAAITTSPAYWRNVSWYHQVDAATDLDSLSHAAATGRLYGSAARWYDDPDSASGGKFEEEWGKHASAMARITLQRPVRMLVHASAMLPEEGDK